MIIKQICWPGIFDRIVNGKKNSAVYVGDAKLKVGDFILFEESHHESGKLTGRKAKKKITRVSKSTDNHLYWSEEDKRHGFTILFFE